MDKKGVEIIYEAITQIIIIILFFSACMFFINSIKTIEIEKMALLEINYICSLFPNSTIKISSNYFNSSKIQYKNNFFLIEEKNFEEKYYGKNKIKIEKGVIEIKWEE